MANGVRPQRGEFDARNAQAGQHRGRGVVGIGVGAVPAEDFTGGNGKDIAIFQLIDVQRDVVHHLFVASSVDVIDIAPKKLLAVQLAEARAVLTGRRGVREALVVIAVRIICARAIVVRRKICVIHRRVMVDVQHMQRELARARRARGGIIAAQKRTRRLHRAVALGGVEDRLVAKVESLHLILHGFVIVDQVVMANGVAAQGVQIDAQDIPAAQHAGDELAAVAGKPRGRAGDLGRRCNVGVTVFQLVDVKRHILHRLHGAVDVAIGYRAKEELLAVQLAEPTRDGVGKAFVVIAVGVQGPGAVVVRRQQPIDDRRVMLDHQVVINRVGSDRVMAQKAVRPLHHPVGPLNSVKDRTRPDVKNIHHRIGHFRPPCDWAGRNEHAGFRPAAAPSASV